MNNYELHEHKKSDTVKWIIAFALIAILLFGMCAILFVNYGDKVDAPAEDTSGEVTTDETAQLSVSDFKTEFSANEGIVLLSASPMVAAANSSYIEQTLTATVLPITASNKTVDWSVSWADSSNTATVTDYVTVTPSSNGSTTATVTCKKAFSGNIIVTVITRESGYTAECIVSYVGKPTDITISSTLTAQSDGYHVGVGNAYTFNIGLTNPLGSVGSGYQNISIELGASGSVVLGYYEYYVSSGNTIWYDSSDTTVTLDSLKDNFITANYSNGVLTINTLKSIESYYESMSRLDSGRTRAYTNAFRSYATDCYFTVKITEKNSGLSETIKIRFDDTVVTSVEMNAAEMSF